MGRFTGGLFSLDPTAFANVGSAGRVTYEKDPTQFGGYKYGSTMFDFTPDKVQEALEINIRFYK
jgi:hypothetical protein